MDNETIFKQEFNPIHFYRTIRKIGFEKEDAKKATRYYARNVYDAILQIFDYKYRGKEGVKDGNV